MQRQMLRLTLVLGVLVTVLGSTGVFAVFSDTARGGTNSVDSGVRPTAADLQIATATYSDTDITCGTFEENLLTRQFSVSGLQPGEAAVPVALCLKNTGAAPLSVTVGAAGTIRNTDSACTGDEVANGDTTCGSDQVGELSPLLDVYVKVVTCSDGTPETDAIAGLDSLQAGAMPIGDVPIPPDGQTCFFLEISYGEPRETDAQIAQSDLVTWIFHFVGTAS